MVSYSHASRHRSGGGMSTPTVLAAKVALASAAAVALAASFARFAVPHLVSVAGAVLSRAMAVARFWLAPPYLFVTVHLIILVIWKLSDHKHFHHAHHHKDPWPVAAPHAPPPVPVASVPAAAGAPELVVKAMKAAEFGAVGGYGGERYMEIPEFSPVSSPEFSPDSGGGESCVTTESSDEDSSSSPPPASYAVRRSMAPPAAAHEHHAVLLQRELSLPTAHAADHDDDGGGGDDDLDATWNAIMQKTRPATAPAAAPPPPPAQPSPPPPRARDPSLGPEEMNRRFDDFIKKNRHSFGRQ